MKWLFVALRRRWCRTCAAKGTADAGETSHKHWIGRIERNQTGERLGRWSESSECADGTQISNVPPDRSLRFMILILVR